MARHLPSPFAYAIMLTLVAFFCSWIVGDLTAFELLDAWASGRSGFWSFLSFSMQMTLILVTGTVVAESKFTQTVLSKLAQLPQTTHQATLLIALTAECVALLHWGLGLIVGAVLAREVGRQLQARDIPVHYPSLAAAGYTGLLVWHGGLSGSAPLKVTSATDLADVLGAELASKVALMPLTETIFSIRNVVVTGIMVVVVPGVIAFMIPRETSEYVAPPVFPPRNRIQRTGSFLDTGPYILVPFVGLMSLWIVRWAVGGGLAHLGPNTLNFVFLAAGLALAGSPARYMELARQGAASATGILVQFPLYAGIRGLLVVSGLGAKVAAVGSAHLLVSTFFAAGLLNLFIPSGGGQWGIQGPVAVQAAVDQGIPVANVVLAIAWGDEWTNAFQPFWALPLLGITGAKAGDLLGITGAVGLVTGIILFLGLVF